MDVIYIDFETYYDTEYSLSKMTTEEYVNDPRFEVIGVSLKVNDEKVRWVTGDHKLIASWFKQFDWENAYVIGHNNMFDMAILLWRFDIHPKRFGDTLSMSRAWRGVHARHSLAAVAKDYGLEDKGTVVYNMRGRKRTDLSLEEMRAYGEYCKLDTDLCYQIFNHMVREGFPRQELQLIDLTLRMFLYPQFLLNRDKLEEHLIATIAAKEQLLDESGVGVEELRSNPKFAALLESMGVEPPMKVSPTTGKETFAFAKTDQGLKDLLEHPDMKVRTIVEARMGVKSSIEETRTERFIGIANRMGKLPIPLRYHGAGTGRWSGSESVNLQNLPSRGPTAGKIKSAIEAPKGFVVIDGDSSQIEARMVAWLAEQGDLLEAFEAGEDVYKIMACAIYNKTIDEILPEERHMGKTTILGAGYGMSPKTFKIQTAQQGTYISEDEAVHNIMTYRRTYPRIPQLWRQADRVLDALHQGRAVTLGPEGVLEICPERSAIRLPSGIWMMYPELELSHNEMGYKQYSYMGRYGRTHIYGAKLIENISQALARCVIAEQMLKYSKKFPVALTVHDAVVGLAPRDKVLNAVKHLAKCMRYRPTWAPDLPLTCEVNIGRDYGNTKFVDI